MSKKGCSFLCIRDLNAPDRLAIRIRDGHDPLSKYLRERCSRAAQQLLDDFDGSNPPTEALQRAVVDQLNRVLQQDCFYEVRRFAQVPWPGEVQRLIREHSQGTDLIRLNRVLLEEAYPQEIVRIGKRESLLHRLLFGRVWSRQRLIRWVAWRLRDRVASGVFQGMLYYPSSAWGNPGNKLIGTYEKELVPYLAALDTNPPNVVFDVGAAEGYYAVGCAFRWSNCDVYAWEMDEASRQQICTNVSLNRVEQRVHVQGACSEDDLHVAITERSPDLIIMDVEGEELNLCSERCIGAASRALWIVETHTERVMKTLRERLSQTHGVHVVANEPRTPADVPAGFPWSCALLPYDRWRLMDEGRPFLTPWIVAKPVGVRD